MKSEDGTGGRRPLLGDVDCHPPILFKVKGVVVTTPFYIIQRKFPIKKICTLQKQKKVLEYLGNKNTKR